VMEYCELSTVQQVVLLIAVCTSQGRKWELWQARRILSTWLLSQRGMDPNHLKINGLW
jgi:hypothetical protein